MIDTQNPFHLAGSRGSSRALSSATAPPAPPAMLYTIEQAANALRTSKLGIRRLIARNRLKAARVGETDERLIRREELDHYAAAGMPDHTGPKISGNWILDETSGLADQFGTALTEAAAQQIPAAEKIDLSRFPRGQPVTMTLAVTQVVREVLARAVPVSAFAPKVRDAKPSRYRDWRELYLVNAFRQAAERVIGKHLGNASKSDAERFYASPESYAAAVAETQAAVMSRRPAVLTRFVARPGDRELTTVMFILPMSSIAPTDVLARVRDLAF